MIHPFSHDSRWLMGEPHRMSGSGQRKRPNAEEGPVGCIGHGNGHGMAMAPEWWPGFYGQRWLWPVYIYIYGWWFGTFGLFFHTIWGFNLLIIYLVGGLEHDFFDFPYYMGMSSSQLTNIFKRGWNHQPDIYIYIYHRKMGIKKDNYEYDNIYIWD